MKDINEFFSSKEYSVKRSDFKGGKHPENASTDLINEYCEKTFTYLAFDRLRDNIADLLVKSLHKEKETTITSIIAVIGIMGMIQDCNEKSDAECVEIINTIKKELKSLYERDII